MPSAPGSGGSAAMVDDGAAGAGWAATGAGLASAGGAVLGSVRAGSVAAGCEGWVVPPVAGEPLAVPAPEVEPLSAPPAGLLTVGLSPGCVVVDDVPSAGLLPEVGVSLDVPEDESPVAGVVVAGGWLPAVVDVVP